MAFKARTPNTFSPALGSYNEYLEWRRDFDNYMTVTDYFAATVNLKVSRARLFNIAGPDFTQFVHETITLTDESTVNDILDAVSTALKPKRLDLQTREKLFSHMQSSSTAAAKYVEELRRLYDQANYKGTVDKSTLIRDLFIAGLASREAKCLIYQQDSDNLSLDQCIHLVSSYETSANPSRPNSSSDSLRMDVTSLDKTRNLDLCHDTSPSSIDVNLLKKPSELNKTWLCRGCGSTVFHPRLKCPAFKVRCRKCDKPGHFARVCRSVTGAINVLQTAHDDQSSGELLQVTTIGKGKGQKKFISATINDKIVPHMLVDSGSDITVISRDLCQRIGLAYKEISNAPRAIWCKRTSC